MKLTQITKPGFYVNGGESDTEGLYELYPNADYIENYELLSEEKQEKLCEEKIRPYSKFLLDLWIYDRKDNEGLKHWNTDGLIYTPEDYPKVNVEKAPGKYKLLDTQINSGCYLVEDKLTYKEKLDKIAKICDKESTKSTFNNSVENKDVQKLAIQILKIIQ